MSEKYNPCNEGFNPPKSTQPVPKPKSNNSTPKK